MPDWKIPASLSAWTLTRILITLPLLPSIAGPLADREFVPRIWIPQTSSLRGPTARSWPWVLNALALTVLR